MHNNAYEYILKKRKTTERILTKMFLLSSITINSTFGNSHPSRITLNMGEKGNVKTINFSFMIFLKIQI